MSKTINPMSIRISKEYKTKFEAIRNKMNLTQVELLEWFIDKYEKYPNISELLLKKYISINNVYIDVTPKKYISTGETIFISSEISLSVDAIHRFCKYLNIQTVISCKYRWTVIHEKENDRYLLYEEFNSTNDIDVRRCYILKTVDDIKTQVSSYTDKDNMLKFEYIFIEPVNNDSELEAFL